MRSLSTLALLLTLLSPVAAHELDAELAEAVDRAFARTDTLAAEAAQLEELYRAGERPLADRVLEVRGEIRRWDRCSGLGLVSARFRAGALELSVHRRGQYAGPFAVAFPPGVYVSPVPNSASATPQPLVILEAPVIVVPRGEQVATRRVRVACARIGAPNPDEGREYQLQAQGTGSALELLLRVACTRGGEADAALQLAVWALRNGTTAGMLAEKSYTTLGTRLPVSRDDSADAEALLKEAGLEPRALPFFD